MPRSGFNYINDIDNTNNFDSIRASFASAKQIEEWSYGEVKKPDTVNYRTGKPEHDGLFCARIFGPVRDYECSCGKYKRMKYRNIVCEKCGVEVTLSKVRRYRMGHIKLAAPVVHVWFLRSLPSRISTVLDIPLKDIERILYFEACIVINAGMTTLNKYQILTEEDVFEYQDQFGDDAFEVGIGAETIKKLLQNIDLEKEIVEIREALQDTSSETKRKKFIKRLKLLEEFKASGNKPEWMVLDVSACDARWRALCYFRFERVVP